MNRDYSLFWHLSNPLLRVKLNFNTIFILGSELKKLNLFLDKYHWSIATTASLLLASTLILTILNPTFLVNDDFAYKSFADGSFTGSPEIELVYVGKLQGLVLYGLYNLSSEIPWYEFLMLATNFISFMFLAQILKNSSVGRIGWFISVATVFSFLVHSPNNTATAVVSGGIAAAYLLRMALETQVRWFRFTPGILLLVFGLSWREGAFFPVFLFATFTLACIFFFRKLEKKTLFMSMLMLSLIGSTVMVIPAINSLCFETATLCDEWKSWNEYDEVRGTLHGAPRGEALLSHVVSGEISTWTLDETRQFLAYYYFDEGTHGYSKMKDIDAQLPETLYGGLDVLRLDPGYLVKQFWPGFNSSFLLVFGSYGWWVFSIFVLVLPSIIKSSPSRTRAVLALCMVPLGPVISLILASTIRLPNYVSVPILGLWSIGYLIMNSLNGIKSSDLSQEVATNRNRFVVSLSLQVLIGVLALTYLRVAQAPVQELLIVLLSSVIGFVFAYVHEMKLYFQGLSKGFLEWGKRIGSFGLVVLVFGFTFSFYSVQLGSRALPSNNLISSSVQEKWGGQAFWGPGGNANFFLGEPYTLGSVSFGRVTFGGWSTFSPHWHQRLDFISAQPPTVENFVDGDLLLLIPTSTSGYFEDLNTFAGYNLEWVGYYDENSLLEIWRVVE